MPNPVLHSFSSEREVALHIPPKVTFYEEATYWNTVWGTPVGANESTNITTAMAVAPAKSYCSNLVTIKSGAISDFIGMLPAMKITEPYSPTARAKLSANPVSIAGHNAGNTTRAKVCNGEAPRVAAACSTSGSDWEKGTTS